MTETVVPQLVPELRFAFEARVDVAPNLHVGHAGGAPVGFVPITGGTVAGPRLNGTVVPGGGDWAVERRGVAIDLDARYLVRADDGAYIDIVNRGFWAASPRSTRPSRPASGSTRRSTTSAPSRSSAPTRPSTPG